MAQTYSVKAVSVLSRIIPFICLLLAGIATAVLVGLEMKDLVLKSLYVSVPVSLASVIAIVWPRWFRDSYPGSILRLNVGLDSFRILVLLFVILFIGSIILLVGYEMRPLGYFVLVGLMSALLLIEILATKKEHTGRRGIILLQITLVAANLIFGQTLRLPYYFGWGDWIIHMDFIDSILDSGHLTALMGDYQYFPGFHIYDAAGILLGGMDLQKSCFIFNGLVFLVSIPVVYLLVKKLTTNDYIPLFAVLLYSISREVIFNGMYMITRVLAFVFCLAILNLLVRSRTSLRLRAAALLFVIPLVFIHHTTLLHFTVILTFLFLIELFLTRSSWNIGITYILYFSISFLGYWLWIESPFFEDTLWYLSRVSDIERISATTLDIPVTSFFAGNADLIVLAFLTLLGAITVLRMRKEVLAAGIVFSLFSFAAFLAFFPGFTDAISEELLSYRWRLLVVPFIVFVAAGGLVFMLRRPLRMKNDSGIWRRTTSGAFVVFFLAFSSSLILGHSTDVNLTEYLGAKNRQYFTESELEAFSTSATYRQEIPFYGDTETLRYLENRLDIPVEESAEVLDPASIESGYMLYRRQEFESRGELTFPLGASDSSDQWYIYRSDDEIDLQSRWEQQQKVFDSETVSIYRKIPPE